MTQLFSQPNFGVVECSKKRDSGFDPVGLVDQDFQNGGIKGGPEKCSLEHALLPLIFALVKLSSVLISKTEKKEDLSGSSFLARKPLWPWQSHKILKNTVISIFTKRVGNLVSSVFLKLNKNRQRRIRRIAASMKTEKILELR